MAHIERDGRSGPRRGGYRTWGQAAPATENAFPGLPHDMTDQRQHRIELLTQAIQRELLQHVNRQLYAFGDFV